MTQKITLCNSKTKNKGNEKFIQFPNHTLEGMASYFQTLDQSKVYAGGYNEMRPMYQSPLFISIEEERNLHIGYDIWLEAGTKIYAPLNSEVHSFAYNDNGLDYGATIILKSLDDLFPFHLLFGHLSMDSIAGLQEGQKFDGGEELARIGNETENGGWFPHLHLQLIREIGDWKG